jgi:transposase
VDVVDQLDLDPFYRAHRDDGHGHPAYDPKTLLGVLLYGYCLGVRSSWQLERRCQEDIAFRVLAANQTPDHVTIARFRARHEHALAGFLVESLKLCAAAGMVKVGLVALDGTKLAGNGADKANRTLDRDAGDFQQLDPMLDATAATLGAAGIQDRPGTLAADSGYWSIANLTQIPDAPQLLIPPPKHGRHGKPRKDGKPSGSKSDGLRAAMTAKLQSEDGKARYAKRKETVEPVFGQLKEQQGARRFLRRGMVACQAEWKLLCGTHNLLKLWRHTAIQQATRPATA